MSSSRMDRYVPLIQEFAARVIFFHSAIAQKLGLHATDLKALRLLAIEPMTAGALGERIGLTAAAVTALIDRLENAGYVARERGSEDRRKITIRAVREQLRRVDDLYAGQYAGMSKLLAKYNEKEFSVIESFLEKTTRMLTEEARKLQDDPG